MIVYFYVDEPDFDELAEPMETAVAEWFEINDSKATFVNQIDDEEALNPKLGLEVSIKKKAELKAPLAFLNDIAQKQKCDFVVGILDVVTGKELNVCYFGYEEGKPDAFEIANYLGL